MKHENKVVVTEVITAFEGKKELLKKALHELVSFCRKEKGCLQYDLLEPLDSNNSLLILMRWQDVASLKNHETSETILNFVKNYEGKLYRDVRQEEWKEVYTQMNSKI